MQRDTLVVCLTLGILIGAQTHRGYQNFHPRTAPLSEISGITHHHSDPDLFWVHNDSLDQPRLFLITKQGEERAEVHIQPADRSKVSHVDWEDIASSRLDPIDGENVIYVADSGNNFHWRSDLKIYAFQNLDGPSAQLKLIRTYPYQLPNQTQRPPTGFSPSRCLDSEALFWRRGELYLIGKCVLGGPTPIWHLPRQSGHVSETIQAKKVATLPIPPSAHPLFARVTAADYHHELDWLAVLTYRSVWVFKLSQTSGPSEDDPSEVSITEVTHCLLESVIPLSVSQAEGITWVENTTPVLRGKTDQPPETMRPALYHELLILTEAGRVHSLSVDTHTQGCRYGFSQWLHPLQRSATHRSNNWPIVDDLGRGHGAGRDRR